MRNYRTWGRSRALRLPVAYYPSDEAVHVILTANLGHRVFDDEALASMVFELIEGNPATLTACLMPNHLHWLLRVEGSLTNQVQRFKSYSTRLAWQQGLEGRLWQRSFYDHLVRNPPALRSVAEYILDNPVRAGLVNRAEDWPFVLNRLDF